MNTLGCIVEQPVLATDDEWLDGAMPNPARLVFCVAGAGLCVSHRLDQALRRDTEHVVQFLDHRQRKGARPVQHFIDAIRSADSGSQIGSSQA